MFRRKREFNKPKGLGVDTGAEKTGEISVQRWNDTRCRGVIKNLILAYICYPDWAKFDPCDTFRIHFSVVAKRVTATREYYRDNMDEALMDCVKLST